MITVKKILVELSKKTLGSYVKKAASSSRAQATLGNEFKNDANKYLVKGDKKRFEANRDLEKAFKAGSNKRMAGVLKAVNKLTKEEVEQVEEDFAAHVHHDTGTHVLVHEKGGKEIKIGAKVKDFRGDVHTIKGFTPPLHSNSTGRVHTNKGHFFPSVVGAKIKSKVKDRGLSTQAVYKEEVEQIDENRHVFTKSSRNHLVRHYPHFHEFVRGAIGQNSGPGDIGETPIRHGMLGHVRLADHLLHHASKHSSTKRGLNIHSAGANADSGIEHDGHHATPTEHDRPTPQHALNTLEKMFY